MSEEWKSQRWGLVTMKWRGEEVARGKRRWPKCSWVMGMGHMLSKGEGRHRSEPFPNPFSKVLHLWFWVCMKTVAHSPLSSTLQMLDKTSVQKLEWNEKMFRVNRTWISLFSLKLIFLNHICKIPRTHLCSAVFANKTPVFWEREGLELNEYAVSPYNILDSSYILFLSFSHFVMS